MNDDEDDIPEIDFSAPVRSHREIADLLGIGRSRVFYLEHQALDKLRGILSDHGINNVSEFDSIPGTKIEFESHDDVIEKFSPQHGWLKADKIISLNDGSESITEIVRAYRFMKELHDQVMRPPVIIAGESADQFVIQAVAQEAVDLYVRCWPTQKGAKRTVNSFTRLQCNIITESVFDSDQLGDFDIPLIICVILSHGRPK